MEPLECLDALDASLAAEAAVLHPTEGRLGERDAPVVHGHVPALERVADGIRDPRVAAEGVGGEPEGEAIGGGDGLVEGPEGHRQRERPEGLDVRRHAARVGVGEDGGVPKEPARPDALAANRDRNARPGLASAVIASMASRRRRFASGPICVRPSNGSPTRQLRATSTKRATKRSWMDSWT